MNFSERENEGLPAGGLIHRLMGLVRRIMPSDEQGENLWAVQVYHWVEVARDLITAGPVRRLLRRARGEGIWPVAAGAYCVGHPTAPVAICTLTSNALMQPLSELEGIAIAGRVYTANLGIEKILLNVTANRSIRFLLLCGKESPVFQPAQALRCLCAHGVDAERRIIGAAGPHPVLRHILPGHIDLFRQQVELIDCTGETDVGILEDQVRSLAARHPGSFSAKGDKGETWRIAGNLSTAPEIVLLRPGGSRQPLADDPKGFFVIALDREAGELVVHHYLPNTTPAHEMRGRTAEGILLGLLRENLVSQLSHAGYLGSELAKAETALRLGLRYEQDQPLRPY